MIKQDSLKSLSFRNFLTLYLDLMYLFEKQPPSILYYVCYLVLHANVYLFT